MNIDPTADLTATASPAHTPFPVANPTASDPEAWEREVARPLKAAELRTRANDLRTALEAPALGLGERAALKRQIDALERRIDALGVAPTDGDRRRLGVSATPPRPARGFYAPAMPHALRLVLLLTVLAAAGCRTYPVVTPPPPPPPAQAAAVYLAHYDFYHTSLLLPQDDGELVEYTYADYDILALDKRTTWAKFKAILLPSRGTLGRGVVRWDHDVRPDASGLPRPLLEAQPLRR